MYVSETFSTTDPISPPPYLLREADLVEVVRRTTVPPVGVVVLRDEDVDVLEVVTVTGLLDTALDKLEDLEEEGLLVAVDDFDVAEVDDVLEVEDFVPTAEATHFPLAAVERVSTEV